MRFTIRPFRRFPYNASLYTTRAHSKGRHRVEPLVERVEALG
jgi:hypothetical protein